MGGKRRLQPFESLRAHEVLLRDRSRTLAYRRAIERSVKKNDVVLDLGCGTGILALFAAKAGGRKIFAVDRTPLTNTAQKVALHNGFNDKVKFVRKDIFRYRPKAKADVLLHEHFGVSLWDEDLTSKLDHARRYCLKKTATMIPRQADLYAVPVDLPQPFERSFNFWRRPYGFDFTPMQAHLIRQESSRWLRPQAVGMTDRRHFLAAPRRFYVCDFRKNAAVPPALLADFAIKRSGRFTGLCVYYRIRLDDRHSFSTGPADPVSHWGQLFLPEPTPRQLRKGVRIHFEITPGREAAEWSYRFLEN